jgi:tellurite resistance protein TerC
LVNYWHWGAFGTFVTIMLILDLTVFHRKSHEPTLKESAGWTAFWCGLAFAFNAIVWFWLGPRAGMEFLTGYLIEWSLSMDNVFVFAVIFSFFRVPLKYQYRVLFWGILGAVGMRLTFVLLGAALIHHAEWIMWIFGLFLIYTGVKLSMHNESDVNPDNNILMRIARNFFPVAKEDHGNHFFAREGGKLCMTPLFLVLLVVESTDVLFAVDSVPAIFGVVDRNADYFRFVVFTSNVFAILGLRALYFLLAGVMDMFRYLNYGLSAVLVFVGLKMIADYWVPKIPADYLPGWFPHMGEGHGHLVPPWLSLVIVLSLLGISIVASLIAQARESKHGLKDAIHEPPHPEGPVRIPPSVEDSQL